MRTPIAAFIVALLIPALAAPAARATPIEVEVRIEGKARTIFEGPIVSDVHLVKGATDSKWRRCNGVTGVNPSVPPGVTPTSASSDAMRIIGESFDGLWNGQWEDYFVERWGPDAQEPGSFRYWGVAVNNVFTAVGGCQNRLDGGDEVLWVFNAFQNRPRLVLYPGDHLGGALPEPASATLGEPFEVEVEVWTSSAQGPPPPAPTRSAIPYADGATVAPVSTEESSGYQSVEVGAEEAAVTDGDGRTEITFTATGWQRIKAVDFEAGAETVVRSNRLDVCVLDPPAVTACGAPPGDAVPRTPPPPLPGELGEEPDEPDGDGEPQPDGGDGQGPGQAGGQAAILPPPPLAAPRPARVGRLRPARTRLDRRRLARGRVRVSWRLREAGAGVARWTVAAKRLGRKRARWVTHARGRRGSSATFRLAAGRYVLRLTVTDTLGNSASRALGRVRVPR